MRYSLIVAALVLGTTISRGQGSGELPATSDTAGVVPARQIRIIEWRSAQIEATLATLGGGVTIATDIDLFSEWPRRIVSGGLRAGWESYSSANVSGGGSSLIFVDLAARLSVGRGVWRADALIGPAIGFADGKAHAGVVIEGSVRWNFVPSVFGVIIKAGAVSYSASSNSDDEFAGIGLVVGYEVE